MKKIFIKMILFFVAISFSGMLVSAVCLFRVNREMDSLTNGGMSMVERSKLVDMIKTVRNYTLMRKTDFGRMNALITEVDDVLDNCSSCHHETVAMQSISEMKSSIRKIKKMPVNGDVFRENMERLDLAAHNAFVSGQSLVIKRSRSALYYMRIAWSVFIASIFFIAIIVVSVAVFFLKKLETNIRSILSATDCIRRGERINRGLVADEFRKIGEAMEMMQMELIAKEEKLLSWSNQCRIVFNAIDDMLAVCNKEGTILLTNETFYRFFNSGSRGTAQKIHDLVCQGYDSDIDCPIQRTIRDGKSCSAEFRKNGRVFEVRILPVRSVNEEITGVLWIGRDRTLLVEMGERGIGSEKFVSLGQLVSGVMHGVNNLLSAIIGFSEMLLECGHLEPEDRERAGNILMAGQNASGQIRNLLEFARIKSVEFKEHDLNEIVDKTLRLKEHDFLAEGIELKKEYAEDVDIRCDFVQVQHIILNLLKNSEDAILEKGGKGVIGLRTTRDDKTAYLEIWDTGKGIPDEQESRIFEPFFSTKKIGKGTGLGLPAVLRAVQAHGGEISLENSAENGTTFRVSLPLIRQSSFISGNN